MNPPTMTSVAPSVITISWSPITLASQTGGYPPFFYSVEYLDVSYITPTAIQNQANSIVTDVSTLNTLKAARLAALTAG